jgi:hypothetical protein
MNKEGVRIYRERERQRSLKNRERVGRKKQGERWRDKNIAEMSLICLLYNRGQSRDQNHDPR